MASKDTPATGVVKDSQGMPDTWQAEGSSDKAPVQAMSDKPAVQAMPDKAPVQAMPDKSAMQGMSDKPYSFESETRAPSSRKRENARADMLIFAARLGIDRDTRDQFEDALYRYVIDVHLNISWYVQRLRRERLRWMFFSAVSLLMLLVTPILILLLSKVAEDWGAESMTSAHIMAVFTGVLAVHKSIAAWLDQRKFIGHFWKAAAQLKELLYSLEEQWRGKAVADGTLTPGFLEAMSLGVTDARRIVREEQTQFYELYPFPSMDLLTRLKDSYVEAQGVFAQHRVIGGEQRDGRVLDRQGQLDRVSRDRRRCEREIHALERYIAELQASLGTVSPAERQRIEEAISKLLTEADQLRRELIKIEAELYALS